ncbi:hypothetical protein HU200_017998 [Digitaria exilis]|uniref:Uncharacterized protein n=1 Tax=Digitaria exilis TaxID=1010633 RepID=A0A835F5P6_9POAL|nr:hypothetical protein HU200_017998 [Digitaria exilis]
MLVSSLVSQSAQLGSARNPSHQLTNPPHPFPHALSCFVVRPFPDQTWIPRILLDHNSTPTPHARLGPGSASALSHALNVWAPGGLAPIFAMWVPAWNPKSDAEAGRQLRRLKHTPRAGSPSRPLLLPLFKQNRGASSASSSHPPPNPPLQEVHSSLLVSTTTLGKKKWKDRAQKNYPDVSSKDAPFSPALPTRAGDSIDASRHCCSSGGGGGGRRWRWPWARLGRKEREEMKKERGDRSFHASKLGPSWPKLSPFLFPFSSCAAQSFSPPRAAQLGPANVPAAPASPLSSLCADRRGPPVNFIPSTELCLSRILPGLSSIPNRPSSLAHTPSSSRTLYLTPPQNPSAATPPSLQRPPPPPNPSRAPLPPNPRSAAPLTTRTSRGTSGPKSLALSLRSACASSPSCLCRPSFEHNPQNGFAVVWCLVTPDLLNFGEVPPRSRPRRRSPATQIVQTHQRRPDLIQRLVFNPHRVNPARTVVDKPYELADDPIPEEQVQQQFSKEGKYNTDNP